VIPKECKRLAEVDFPIAQVSEHSARDRSVRVGHPSSLHLWWARRPLAACRAVLLGLLWPDPCDPRCPQEFKQQARRLLPTVQGTVGPSDADLRHALLTFIGDFASWDLSRNRAYSEVSSTLTKCATGGESPLVVDPFAGGGSIPLEALRLGCDAFAGDLNPVSCLILKTLLEDLPRQTGSLIEELSSSIERLKSGFCDDIEELYPRESSGRQTVAHLWSRTVRCESPKCGAEIPLVRSFWLSNRKSNLRAIRYTIDRSNDTAPEIRFEVFSPKTESEVPPHTVNNAKATCICCGATLPATRVKVQLRQQNGGADVDFDSSGQRCGGARLLAVVVLTDGVRLYRLPSSQDYASVRRAQNKLLELKRDFGPEVVPNEPIAIPSGNEYEEGDPYFKFTPLLHYGITNWGRTFTARQKLSLALLCRRIASIAKLESEATAQLLSLAVGKVLRHSNVLAKWHRGSETVAGAFGLHALPMSWDFPELHPFAPYAGGFDDAVDTLREVVRTLQSLSRAGISQNCDATESPLPDESADVFFTDPPYYDAIPYSDLSDFFYVWHRRSLPGHPTLNNTFDPQSHVTPKSREIIDNLELLRGAKKDTAIAKGVAVKDRLFFESRMRSAFAEGRRILKDSGIACIVFAHKTTEGWEALLSGIVRSNWAITASWPIATERRARLRARDSAALSTSVHLICRPRDADAPVGDWREVLGELPKRVTEWMNRLQAEGVRGADLVFACIGPALEVFSKYSRVEMAEGEEVKLDAYLEKVWEVVGRAALRQILDKDTNSRDGTSGLEEDARLTALFLWSLQTTVESGNGAAPEQEYDEDEEPVPEQKQKGFSLLFDVVRRFAQPLGIHLPDWEKRIIETKKGVVRLLPVGERAKQLFGEDGSQGVADALEESRSGPIQLTLFPEDEPAPRKKKRKGRKTTAPERAIDEAREVPRDSTTLDRVHLAMLLQAGGRANALRNLIKGEQDRGPEFLRLANALSALYPKGCEEKRLLDAMLLAVPK